MENKLCHDFDFLRNVCTGNAYDFQRSIWRYNCDDHGYVYWPATSQPISVVNQLEPIELTADHSPQLDGRTRRLGEALPWLIKRQAYAMIKEVLAAGVKPSYQLIAQTHDPIVQDLLTTHLAQLEWQSVGGTKAAN